jgi:peptide-methionine (S)-S-oxide reductase
MKLELPSTVEALPGRAESIKITNVHYVHQRPIQRPFPSDYRLALFGLGCFWGAEQVFWKLNNVYTTAVGYSGGITPNPTYEEVCSGLTGHNEVVQVVYYPEKIDYRTLLKVFWEAHDPTQGMRQGNDFGTQYRSSIFTQDLAQTKLAEQSIITTEICPATTFYFAEDYHQQYLAKNPGGYCGLGGTGVPFN